MQKICHYIDFNIANMQFICKKYAQYATKICKKYAKICRICISLCICIFCIYMHSPLCWCERPRAPGLPTLQVPSELVRVCDSVGKSPAWRGLCGLSFFPSHFVSLGLCWVLNLETPSRNEPESIRRTWTSDTATDSVSQWHLTVLST